MPQKKKGKIGSSFDAFLAEEGIVERCEEQALRQILADQIMAAMQKDSLTKSLWRDATYPATRGARGWPATAFRTDMKSLSIDSATD